jgi:hypothetical protein
MTPSDLKELTIAHVKQAYLDGVNAGIAGERQACAMLCADVALRYKISTSARECERLILERGVELHRRTNGKIS